MSESLTPHNKRECQVPLVSLVNEAYGEILGHNKGKLGISYNRYDACRYGGRKGRSSG